MSSYGTSIETGYFYVPSPKQHYAPQGRSWVGVLELELTTLLPLHIGSGAIRVQQFDNGETAVVMDVTRMRRATAGDIEQLPVIPGSSLKGAVRVVFEALTGSCDPFSRACPECAACYVFGSAGQRGRLGFDEAVPKDGEPDLEFKELPQRFGGKQKKQGESSNVIARRFYHRFGEQSEAKDTEPLLCVPSGVKFKTQVTLNGIDDAALGALVVALGATTDIGRLRLGGGKNRRLGMMEVQVTRSQLARALNSVSRIAPTKSVDTSAWVAAARERFEHFDEVADQLRSEYVGPEGSSKEGSS